MRRPQIYKTCLNEACASKDDKSLGNIYGDPRHDIFVEDGREYATCEVCQETYGFNDPNNAKKFGYPQYNASIGRTFQDKAEERAYARKNKLVALN